MIIKTKMRSLDLNFRNRKGNIVLDSLLVIIVLFVLAIVSVMTYRSFSAVNDIIQNDTNLVQEARDQIGDLEDKFPSLFDGIFIMSFGLLWILVIASSLTVDTHPMFFVLILILLVGILFTGAVFSNAYQSITGNTDIAAFASSFPMTNQILENFVTVIIGISFSIGISLYLKSKAGE